MSNRERPLPRATYRVQLHKDFGFRDATALVDYLAGIGFSHLYCSPIMAARPGSTHGYDVIDHNRLNPELGDEGDFNALVARLHEHGMGLILDIVPNHVGIGSDNAAWMDVLEFGQASPQALFFDIDWKSSRRNLEGKVLLPVLGDHFGEVLKRGEFQLKFDGENGSFNVWYYDNRLPVSPLDYTSLLRTAVSTAPALEPLLARFDQLSTKPETLRDTAIELKRELAQLSREPAVAEALQSVAASYNGEAGVLSSWTALGELLDRQAYRPAYWRTSSDEINYRRFFDINDLAGLRVELDALFDAAHRKTLQLVHEGKVDGLRVDHIDGLYDPRAYAQRLQAQAGSPGKPLYIVLEKILAPHEDLPDEWPVAGTTGYDTLNLIGGLFVDPESERALSTIYKRYTRRGEAFDDILYDSKKRILQVNLASEVGVLANAVQTLSASHWLSRDYTYAAIRRAVEELIARFPVYRTYLDREGRLSAADKRHIDWAVGVAKKNAGPIETTVFDFIARILSGELAAEGSPYDREQVFNAAMRFQQLSGPAMAKGLEDTSFYRYFRLLSHNEVGGDPRRFTVTPSSFHRANEQRLQKRPMDMLSGTTHDTKRGEDGRARIACLSGLTSEWARRLSSWSRLNRRLITEVDGVHAPERNHEFYFYQTLIGAWPPTLAIDDVQGLATLAERVDGALLKAVREGKERSTWTHPNEAYERALSAFIRGALDASRPNPFLADFQPFALRVAQLGAWTSLSQTLLRLTMPGVPDVYRGAELWELSMVDPDNRLPVDYPARREAVASLDRLFPHGLPKPEGVRELRDRWVDGRAKLHLIRRALQLRKELPRLFAEGSYRAIEAEGERAANVLAFQRSHNDRRIIAVIPRLWPQLFDDNGAGPSWGDTRLSLPPGRYQDVLSGRTHDAGAGGRVALSQLLADFPVALLLSR